MNTTHAWRLRALLLFVSFLAAVLMGEAALRVVLVRLPVPFLIYLSPGIKDGSPETWERIREWLPALNIRREDPDTGWTFKPNIEVAGRNEDGEQYQATTSPEGFFTPDQPDWSTNQLITVGASFLSTFYVRRPLQDVLRAELGVPVYNLAAGGWGPENFRAAYAKFAAGRRHDTVVVFTAASDMAIVNNWNIWKAAGTSESFLTWTQRSAAADDSVNRGASWPDTHLVLWNLAKFALRQAPATRPSGVQPFAAPIMTADASMLEQFPGETEPFGLQLTRGQLFMDNDPEFFLPGGGYYPYMQAYFESLARLKDMIEENHASMVLVWIPLKERVYVPLLAPEREGAYMTNRTHDIGGLERAVALFAEREGIAHFNLAEPLIQRARRGEKLYFTVDGHFNSAGNDIAGRLVADFIKGLPEHAPEPATTRPPLYYRRGAVQVERPYKPADMTYSAAIVHQDGTAWTARGTAESRFSYLAQWPPSTVTEPRWLIATGVVRRGGITVGLLKDDKWELQFSISNPGAFDVALPVTTPGQYVGVLANNLPEDSLETDVEITSFGWAPIK